MTQSSLADSAIAGDADGLQEVVVLLAVLLEVETEI